MVTHAFERELAKVTHQVFVINIITRMKALGFLKVLGFFEVLFFSMMEKNNVGYISKFSLCL